MQLGDCTELYATGHVGNTHNKFRESDRKFYGADVCVTNTSYAGLSMTAYGKTFTQNNSADSLPLNQRYPAQAGDWLEARTPQLFYTPTSFYLGLADRDFWAMGLKSRWRPFYDACGLANCFAVTSGYEYSEISRTNVTYDLENLTPPVEFTQPDTNTNMFFVGLQQDWSREVNTYIRYRLIDNQWPMLGVTHREQLSLDAAINSNQPENENRIEIGGYWTPATNFLMNASFWIQNSSHHSEYVNFDQDNYPVVVSAGYAPNPCWSFTAGLATFSDWINQDVTLGRENGLDAGELTAWTSPWSYQGLGRTC